MLSKNSSASICQRPGTTALERIVNVMNSVDRTTAANIAIAELVIAIGWPARSSKGDVCADLELLDR